MFSKYNITARIYPAIICSIPIFVLNYFLLSNYTSGLINSLEKIKWIGGITFSVALTFLLAQLGRFIGKELFEKTHFNDELRMPTTNILLHSNSLYSPEHTDRIHSKILVDFGIQVFSAKQEEKDVAAARRTIAESVSMIRAKVGNGQLLLQHNTEYGFARNLVGGSVPALYMSVVNLYIFGVIFPNSTAYFISIFTSIAYFLLVLMGKQIIDRYGMSYAKILVQEYLIC